MKIKIVILLVIQILFFSCKDYTFNNTFEVSFEQTHNNMPCVEVQIKNQKYVFGIDTGSYEPIILFSPGIEKYFGSYEQYNNQKRKNAKKKGGKYIFTIPELKIQNIPFKKIPVTCYELKSGELDGIIGLSFFYKFKNFALDYINRKVIINNKLLETDSICSFKISREYKIVIPIRLNKNTQYAIIDTGLDSNEYRYILINGKIRANKLFKINESKYGDAYIYDIELEIGNVIKEQIWAIKSSEIKNSSEFIFGESAKNFTRDKNIIGNAVFADHIIQIDFENMEFRIQ